MMFTPFSLIFSNAHIKFAVLNALIRCCGNYFEILVDLSKSSGINFVNLRHNKESNNKYSGYNRGTNKGDQIPIFNHFNHRPYKQYQVIW